MTHDPPTDDIDGLRPYLFSIAYRMLGDASEGEDVVQEAFLRYVAGAPDLVASPKAYLATVITRLCLDELKSARVTRAAYHGPWLPEPVLTADLAPGPEEQAASRDDVSLAFLVLLERLSPEERAAFVLREAFDYQYDDIASILHKTNAASRKLVQRARQRVETPRRREHVSPEAQRRLTERFILAARQGDLDRLEDLLAADATSWMDGGDLQKAARRPIRGRDRVARQMIGLLERIFPDVVFSFEPVNGGVAVLWWQADRLLLVMMASIVDGTITNLHCVMNPAKVAYLRQRVSPPVSPTD
jgi:RNA polymerase sigma-70 factor (ECF subfamily)